VSKYYHCGADPESQCLDWGSRRTLCGKEIYGISWDFAIHFIEKTHSDFSKLPQCPECLNHPDLPLVLLGDMP